MTIKKVNSGWQVNIQPGGRAGKRLKKTFTTKAEAIAWERHIRAKVQEVPDWTPPRRDARLLTELVDIWHRHHGSGLNAGEDTKNRLLAMCEAMGNPRAEAFTAEIFAEYRARRMGSGVTASNMNREHAYLRAMFNELIRLKHWKKENPLKHVRAFKVQEQELTYLTAVQIVTLLTALASGKNPHVACVSKVCLATGARWGEAEGLRRSQIKNGMIQFVQTKSSKARAVPITEGLEQELIDHFDEHGDPANGRLFETAFAAFREGVERASVVLPAGQLTHVLRHTFASHFMMNGGNILALQRALGHHSLTMTMRYAHLSPEHLAETRWLNPVACIENGGAQGKPDERDGELEELRGELKAQTDARIEAERTAAVLRAKLEAMTDRAERAEVRAAAVEDRERDRLVNGA
ncbi:tyrosine-type recombinase/integrase [Paraburkholderia sp. B3]|uniref:phage integrase n=1 Tax=Paraburkholderia sp. B3 TaxID=3134791 RepID=UPI003981DBE0